MRRTFFVFILIGLPLLASATILPAGFQEDLVVYGLRYPVAAEYAPDGRLFILEKGGTIRIFNNGVLLSKPFLKVPVNDLIERGLLGLALDPDFANNHYVYIYRTTSAGSPKNRVERYTANGDVAARKSRKILISGIRSDNGQHNAGGLRFGPDGKLYVSTGDGGVDHTTAQDLNSLNGKILRINPDGSIPADNPFINRADARHEVWCYGLRNPWRFAIHPTSGLVAIGDVGAVTHEEINIGRARSNYGWPIAEGPSTNPNFINPIFDYTHVKGKKDAAINGGVFYTANKFPSKYRDRLFITDYVRGFLKVLSLDSAGNLVAVEDFATKLHTPVHLTQTPDGSLLWVSIYDNEVRKIRYVGGNNRPPVVSAVASTNSGKAPFTVNFSSKGTRDPDGDPIQFSWNFGDGSTSTAANPQHTFFQNGKYFVTLTVGDNKNGSASAQSIAITVGNFPPEAIILKPAAGLVVHSGDVVSFAGKGVDAEDGVLNSRFLFWSAEIHHNNHTHPFFDRIRGNKGSFVVPAPHDAGTFFYRLQLEVLDSAGVRSRSYVDIIHEP
jgi:glucose/arabinose dehydrogenase